MVPKYLMKVSCVGSNRSALLGVQEMESPTILEAQIQGCSGIRAVYCALYWHWSTTQVSNVS